eukprot:24187-Pelagococcus_subviridis.AAC.2
MERWRGRDAEIQPRPIGDGRSMARSIARSIGSIDRWIVARRRARGRRDAPRGVELDDGVLPAVHDDVREVVFAQDGHRVRVAEERERDGEGGEELHGVSARELIWCPRLALALLAFATSLPPKKYDLSADD